MSRHPARRGQAIATVILLGMALLALITEWHHERRPPAAPDAWSVLAAPLGHARVALFDAFQRLAPRQRHTQPVTLVEIDEDSLQQLGQWPWPRQRLAALVHAIHAAEPAAIGIDIYMPEADATSPEQFAARLPAAHTELKARLAALPSHDAELAAELFRAPTVLGAAGFDFQTSSTKSGLRLTPIQHNGIDPLPFVRQFPWVLASLPELQNAAHGQALLSLSQNDTVIRRIPLLMAVGDQLAPSLALEMLRVATGGAPIEVRAGSHGIEQIKVADLAIDTHYRGEFHLHFAERNANSQRQISAARVLAGGFDPAQFKGKLVLIGTTGLGLTDARQTPLGQSVPGIEIQAQLLENLLEGRHLQRPGWMIWSELALMLTIGALLIAFVPRHRQVVRMPHRRLLLLFILHSSFFFLAFIAFRQLGLLFDAASLFIALTGVLATRIFAIALQIEAENQRLAREQQRLRETAARVAGELAAARQIQQSSLPVAERVLAGETRFGITTVLEPAREIGGDLYDFFMLDASRLFFVVGDVSGKGVPASLFMAVTKALAKSVARRSTAGLNSLIGALNAELCSENPEALFVTFAAGIYDAESGRLQLCNAGHDAPLCRRADGRIDTLAAASGPPLGVVDGFAYAIEEFHLQKNDSVLIYTDGLTEAHNRQGELYGLSRVRQVLSRPAPASGGQIMLDAVRQDLRDFVGETDASDDLTLLILQRQ